MNSYYNPQRVEQLVHWACAHFGRVDVMTAGYEAAHTLVAAGIAPPDAVRRVQRAVRKLRYAAITAFRECGIDNPEDYVCSWTEYENRPRYRDLKAYAYSMYQHDLSWRQACQDLARAAVSSIAKCEPSPTAIEAAVSYPLAEIPILLDSPAVFGVEHSVFAYHRPFDISYFLLQGRCSRNQGFIVLSQDAFHDWLPENHIQYGGDGFADHAGEEARNAG